MNTNGERHLVEAASVVAAFCAEARKHRDDPEFAKDTAWVAAK